MRGSSRDMPKGRGGSRSRESDENVDIEILRKEYRNMQANRNAFAHESDLVRSVLFQDRQVAYHQTSVLDTITSHHRYCESNRRRWTSFEPKTKLSKQMCLGFRLAT